jgi:putative hemolysin
MLYIELAIVVALILLNGLFALAELAIVSSRRARLQALVDRQVIGSRRALAPATDPGRFLSTVQIGITLVGVLSGAFSGATLGLHLAKWFVDLGLRASVAHALGVGLVVAVITYLSLVIGELVPKQIALRDPEKNRRPGGACHDSLGYHCFAHCLVPGFFRARSSEGPRI